MLGLFLAQPGRQDLNLCVHMYMDAIWNNGQHKATLSFRMKFLSEWMRSESSDLRVYMKHFLSEWTFILITVCVLTVEEAEMFTAHLCHYGGDESHQEDPGKRVGKHGNIVHHWRES